MVTYNKINGHLPRLQELLLSKNANITVTDRHRLTVRDDDDDDEDDNDDDDDAMVTQTNSKRGR